MEKYIVGIDVGTSAVKVGVFNCYGEIAAYEKKEYPTESPKSNYAEQNPELWWSAVNNCIIKIFKKNKIPPNFVKAIGVTGQTRTQVFVNYKGEPLRPAIIWQDRRSFNEAKWINRKFSKKDIIHYLGYQPPIDFSFPSARLLWVKNHECRIFEKTYKVLQPKDYINYKLTSNLSSDISSSFGLINIKTEKLNEIYFKDLGIPTSLLAKLCKPYEVIGGLNEKSADMLGLLRGTPVIAGTMDAWCNLLGSGIASPGYAMEIAGTSEIIGLLSRNNGEAKSGIICMPFSKEFFFYGGPTQSGGDSLRWFTEKFKCLTNSSSTKIENEYFNVIDKVKNIKPGSDGLLFLPYLAGERTPLWDPYARGAFIGITKEHNKNHFIRAILEGVGYSIRHVLELAEKEANYHVENIRTSGGGAKSDVWNQIKADITGKPIYKLKISETALLGAAILAGYGIKIFDNFDNALREMVHVDQTFMPDIKNYDVYSKSFKIYKRLYPLLKEQFKLLSSNK